MAGQPQSGGGDGKTSHPDGRGAKTNAPEEKDQSSVRQALKRLPTWARQPLLVLYQSVKDSFVDSVPHWAAAVAYYSLLSVFPLLLAAVSIAAYFVDPGWATDQATRLMGSYLPRGESMVRGVIEEVISNRGSTSLLSILVLLWTGSRVFGVLTRALNIAYDVESRYSFWERLLVEVGMTLSVGVVFLLALASEFLSFLLWDALQVLPAGGNAVYSLVRLVVPIALLLLAFFLVYRYVPHGHRHTQSALIAAVVATGLFLVARPLFHEYVQRFSQYNLVYGSLAIVIILMVWAWIVAFITLFGGELASHLRMMVFEKQAPEQVEGHHKERSGQGQPSQSRQAPQS